MGSINFFGIFFGGCVKYVPIDLCMSIKHHSGKRFRSVTNLRAAGQTVNARVAQNIFHEKNVKISFQIVNAWI